MSRYLERAEHTARLLDLNLNLMLDQAPDPDGLRWPRLLESLMVVLPERSKTDAYSVAQALTFDAKNKASIIGCMNAARENARQVREQISSEMWEELNQLYLKIKRAGRGKKWQSSPHLFFRGVKEGAHLFQGITDSTLSHSEGWHFIQAGRFIERASATAALLEAHVGELYEPTDSEAERSDYLDMVGLLKSCTAFEAYCKVYTADLSPQRIAEFLLLNSDFPRSVRFAAEMIQTALNAIAELAETRKNGRANRLAVRLRAALSFGQIDEIMASGLRPYLYDIQRQCAQIHTAIYQQYVSYPIEAALGAEGRQANQ
ncbi:MAG: alpha-E domain-containing protein [Pyrinomonadaceae bacterium]|nr:alpha-E domain-containing protein [Pyrinomonadaceae bacterium]